MFGEPFKDEFHSRLHFNHRGQVAMANSKPNDNGSQACAVAHCCCFSARVAHTVPPLAVFYHARQGAMA